MQRFLAGFSAVRSAEWAEKKIKTVPHVFSVKNRTKTFRTVPKCINDMMHESKNNWGSNCEKLKNNEARPKFMAGSYKKKRVVNCFWVAIAEAEWQNWRSKLELSPGLGYYTEYIDKRNVLVGLTLDQKIPLTCRKIWREISRAKESCKKVRECLQEYLDSLWQFIREGTGEKI